MLSHIYRCRNYDTWYEETVAYTAYSCICGSVELLRWLFISVGYHLHAVLHLTCWSDHTWLCVLYYLLPGEVFQLHLEVERKCWQSQADYSLYDPGGSYEKVLFGFHVQYCDSSIPIFKLLAHLYFRKKSSRTITFDEFKVALGELARKKHKEKTGEEAEEEVFKLIEGKTPVIAGVTVRLKMWNSQMFTWLTLAERTKMSRTLSLQRAVASPTVNRLTDPTKFTGSHKERFDDTGRGKGKAGRVDVVDTSGYVSGYKHRGSYEKKVTKPTVPKPMWGWR